MLPCRGPLDAPRRAVGVGRAQQLREGAYTLGDERRRRRPAGVGARRVEPRLEALRGVRGAERDEHGRVDGGLHVDPEEEVAAVARDAPQVPRLDGLAAPVPGLAPEAAVEAERDLVEQPEADAVDGRPLPGRSLYLGRVDADPTADHA